MVRRRRRPPLFRRPPRRRPPIPRRIRRALARANRLMAAGQHAEAAEIFARLSDKAREHHMPVRAADLALRSSRAYFAADALDTATEWAKRGLRLMARGGRVGRVPVLLSKMTAALREKGCDAQADQLEQEVEQALQSVGLSLDEAQARVPQVPDQHGSLPAECAGCGGPLIPDEVEWHDAHTAECPYCGTLAKAS